MTNSRLETWKISVDARAQGFHLRLRVSNAFNKGWFNRKKSKLFQLSLRANIYGGLLRIKAAASRLLGTLGDQSLNWKNVKWIGEFSFKKKSFRIKGCYVDPTTRPNHRNTSCCFYKSCNPSYGRSFRNIIVTQKKSVHESHNDNSYPKFWEAQLTSLMGNLSLLSYFVNKRERGASIVQAAGVLTTLIVLLQLAIAGAMPLLVFCATAAACLIGFAVNSLNYTNFISDGAWKVWTDILGVGGMYVLTQVVWLTFVPRLPRSKLPGIIAAALLLVFIELANWGWLPAALLSILEGISGWIATLLFIWSPVSQLYSNIRNPANLHGLSVFTILLALVGNGMLIPRALFIRDMMWFTGSSWGSIVQGWAILLSMYLNKAANSFLFWGVTCGFILWLGAIALKDMHAYSLSNPLDPFIELLQGKRKYEISK
ncbi:maltose excess protein 1-like, chloroplastic isoform X1 [Cryptomeria japonica]|uniref:maltose excess protein 1-like, chloroplastic isoform X1 n=1 Tax=Cryptomeria japonica TaxID=3369 RepID=UPI0027DA803E|nr:maltose excess protein 1-like, chloroplastic isoform X1 [Cryptomeria japonica]